MFGQFLVYLFGQFLVYLFVYFLVYLFIHLTDATSLQATLFNTMVIDNAVYNKSTIFGD